jgi:hypothetical protein
MQGKTQQDEATKWRCKVCTKPFRGEEFVHKHIRVKHPEEVKSTENNVNESREGKKCCVFILTRRVDTRGTKQYPLFIPPHRSFSSITISWTPIISTLQHNSSSLSPLDTDSLCQDQCLEVLLCQ